MATLAQKLKCLIGKHDWLLVSGSQKQTGYAIAHIIFAVHELQEDEVCDCCRLRRTHFGLLPHYLNTDQDRKEFPFIGGGITSWPADKQGNKLPSYVCEGIASSYSWHPDPIYRSKETDPNIKLVRRSK